MSPAVDGILATHPIVSAIPFFVPTFIVAAVIAVIIWRDRHHDDDEPATRPEDTEDTRETEDTGDTARRPG
ncbi:hypothetical protein [Actinomadura sp. 9N407]|uniref:hypothetical protein n=1 Tax=Actinomadura sp. 9N407 TaxID=3375154 RepID=UPI00378A6905